MKIYSLAVFVVGMTPSLLFANSDTANWVGVSQGVSSPTLSSPLNFSSGFTPENPVGIIYQQGVRATLEGDSGDDGVSGDNQGFGGELGIGNGDYGLGVGYYSRDCTDCEGRLVGALGATLADVGIGIRFGEDIYGAGLLFNVQGQHRFGLVAQLTDPDGDGNRIQSFAAGYSYIGNQVSFALDASKNDFEDSLISGDTILVTPGLGLHFKQLTFTLSYDHYLKNDTLFNDGLWFGLGFGDKGSWYLTLYHKYNNEFSASLSFFF